jgi:hypothetical protein
MIKRKTLEKPSDVVLPNFKKITGEKEEKEKVPV